MTTESAIRASSRIYVRVPVETRGRFPWNHHVLRGLHLGLL